MSNTYRLVQNDAQRSLYINWARIVARVEQGSLFTSALVRLANMMFSCGNICQCLLDHVGL